MKLLILDEYDRGPWVRWLRQWKETDVAGAKLDPLDTRHRQLRRSLGVCIEHLPCTLDGLPNALQAARPRHHDDPVVAFYVPSWRHDAEHFAARLAALPARPERPPLVLFDTFDQTSSPYFTAIPSVDLYLKSQLLRDRSVYRKDLSGGFVVADWVRQHLDFDLADWHFGGSLDPADEPKLALGWSMGAARHYRRLDALCRLIAPAWTRRPIDLNRRFAIPQPGGSCKWEWYQAYRRFCGLRAAELAPTLKSTDSTPVSRPAYLREMMRSKLVFSPFGWGEICFRDFEAIACGSVLVKPDVSHLETNPDVFEPWVTYAPVRWDLADLADVCQRLLSSPDLAIQIATAARTRLLDYLDTGLFDTDLGRLLTPLVSPVMAP